MSYAHWRPQRNWGARVREFTWQGMRAISLENELLRVSILLDKGSDVFELLYKPLDVDFVWLTANGFRDPRSISTNTADDAVGAFIDSYGGGWQEILPNGGLPSTHAGASFAQHGEVALLPWDYELVEDTEQAVTVRLTVACLRTPLRIVKELRLEAGSPRLELSETLTNESPVEIRAMWGHHLTFGKPFLVPGARLTLPDGIEVVEGPAVDLSRIPGPGAPSAVTYLGGFGKDAWYELARDDVGFRVGWDGAVMPYLWFWQEYGGSTGWEWYGRHWNVGLEPFSSYPSEGIGKAVENGTAMTLAPHERRTFTLSTQVTR
jgi:hypothetical protein